MGIRSLREI